jgi:FkbM family methyltransferase
MSGPFVSHAQNLEDVMLWRALGDVGDGFYVDVGAFSPADDSVTLAFSERGWRGVNIEPNAALHARFVAERPRDVNLEVAIGDREGETTLYLVENPGLSTVDEREARAREHEGMSVRPVSVRVETLRSVWAAHVPPGQPVHFLKIDVEGHERAVIAGADWASARPWVVVVEATRPMTTEPSHADWEPLLLDADYVHAYADGLNRFYVAREHAGLLAAFAFPPNYFDGYVRASEAAALERARHAEAELAVVRAELAAVTGSRSWRLTAPLRAAKRRLAGRSGGRPAVER